MATMMMHHRLQILRNSSPILISSLLPKYPSSSSFSSHVHCKNHHHQSNFFSNCRLFTATPLFCSKSPDQEIVVQKNKTSIVGDLLDYLNESWTHFHATTAEAKKQLLAVGFHLLNESEEWDLKPGGRYFFTRNMSCLVAFAVGEKDLSVAGSFEQKLVKVKRPLLRVPTLAIHLDNTINKDGFKINLETHLIPVLATKSEEPSMESKDKAKVYHHPLLMQVSSPSLLPSIVE